MRITAEDLASIALDELITDQAHAFRVLGYVAGRDAAVFLTAVAATVEPLRPAPAPVLRELQR